MGKYDETVDKLFAKHVKPMKLPPRLAGQIKHAMEAAAKSSKGDTKETRKAIAAYLTERGYDPDSGKKLKKAKKPKKEKPAKKPKRAKKEAANDNSTAKKPKKSDKDPAKEAVEKAGAKKALKGDVDAGVPKGNIDLRKLNRQTLKGMAKDLGVKYKKKWTDDELRAQVAKLMVGVDEKVTAELAKADPAKIDAQKDCIGVLLDLTKAICITCPAQTDCRQMFESHRADGFKIFQTLQPGSTNDGGGLVPASSLTKKAKKKEATVEFDPKKKIDVFEFEKVKALPKVEVDGAKVKSNMEHKTFLRAVKEEVPETLGEFRDVVLKHYDASDDDKEGIKLTTWFAKYCEALEVIKFA